MKAVLEYIFKKHWYVFAGMLAVFVLCKYWAVTETQKLHTSNFFQTQWIQEMYDLSMDERKIYLENLMDALHQIANEHNVSGSDSPNDVSPTQDSDDSGSIKTENTPRYQVNVDSIHIGNVEMAVSEYWQLYAAHQNQQELYNLIQFAQNGVGVVPVVLPDNYLNSLDFYAQMEEPRLINETPLDIYFNLQNINLLPLISFFVLAVYFSIHYETQVYKYTLTTPNGKKYNRQLKWVPVALFLGLFAVNETFDLLYSGVIFNSNLLNSSVQSYSEFENAQIHATIGDCLFYIFTAKILGLLVICQFTDIISWFTKNTKDTMVGGTFLFLFLFILSQTLESSKLIALLQIGMVNWQECISSIRVCLPIGCSYATIGFGITLMLALGSFWTQRQLYHRLHF